MLQAVRDALNQIERILSHEGEIAYDLLSILTALRSADQPIIDPPNMTKSKTTAKVRRAAFPTLQARRDGYRDNLDYALGMEIAPDTTGLKELLGVTYWGEQHPQHHFLNHFRRALEAIYREDD